MTIRASFTKVQRMDLECVCSGRYNSKVQLETTAPTVSNITKLVPNREVHPDARHRIMVRCAAPQSAAVFGERYRGSRITAPLGDGAPPECAESVAGGEQQRRAAARSGLMCQERQLG